MGADVGLGLRLKNFGARVKSVEDPRLLTGQGAFMAYRIVPGALRAACRRSDHAHALISNIGTSARPRCRVFGAEIFELPMTPERLFCLAEEVKAGAQGE